MATSNTRAVVETVKPIANKPVLPPGCPKETMEVEEKLPKLTGNLRGDIRYIDVVVVVELVVTIPCGQVTKSCALMQ